jgi:cellulose synthase/poly-beta-1,6-N-acetylglucosamine synthase-like glycosyltransferase
MLSLAVFSAFLALFFLAFQVYWACRFALRYVPRSAPKLMANGLPRATVLLCIRGADPSLLNCLNGLLHQDYPDYDIRIVIDSADDPAWDIVSATLARTDLPTVKVNVLVNRQETCSLKLSALVQAIGELEEATAVVALIDADVIPYRHWLRDLVQPLVDPQVGATSGVRWYMPRGQSSWGTLVRSAWNGAACAQMDALHIPWGGSMAFRAELFRQSDLLERWARSFVEDTGSHRVLRSLGLRLCHVPQATMVNHETIDLRDCFRFIRRQLLNARLYHESWIVILTMGVGTPLALAGAVVPTLANGLWQWAAGLGTLLVGSFFTMVFFLSIADRQINRLAQKRGAPPYPFAWKLLLVLPLTQAIYLAGLVSACFLRKIEWRGITYEVDGSGRIRLMEYRPYQRASHVRKADTSLV